MMYGCDLGASRTNAASQSRSAIKEQQMKIDVAGRVRNVPLPTSKPLLPLFEAIINSIQAIEDAKQPDGAVTIKLLRDSTPTLIEIDRGSREIVSFEIKDNGVGFNDDNFSAFQTSDTTYKADRGGKGIGRFVWLVAFDSVTIQSTFETDGQWKTRSFNFVARGDGIDSEATTESPHRKRETTIRLLGFKQKFQSAAPKKADTIGAHIVEHCLEYLIRPNPPQLTLVDDATSERIDLNAVFEKEMAANAKSVPFKVEDADFSILHVRLYSTHIKDHLLHYCANNRVVKSEKLAGRVPDLAKHLTDAQGREFIYASYLDSPMLDSAVNPERTDFSIASEEESLFRNGPTWTKIRDAAVGQIRRYLAPFTKPVRERKEQRIERFVATQGPMYRPILKYVENEIGLMDPDIDDNELELKLYRAYHDLQVKIAAEGSELIRTQSVSDDDFGPFASKFEQYFAKVGDVNKADLARYVFHRRTVLEFLQHLLNVRPGGKYSLESRVHQLIFPMGATSAEVPFDGHNLWLVDERLVYHKFLASDKQLRVMEPLNNKSKNEPDIIVFDKACAFANSSEGPFQTITIIEFKRPMRTSYPEHDNPFDQILEYIRDIRSGKARTREGRDVPVAKGVHFYCYIIADKSESLEQQAYKAELEKTPDGQGFFGYKKHYRAYFEVISYTKLCTDAKQRNRVFFDKLGLPASTPTFAAEEGPSSPEASSG
jgi:hypothetical protein